MTNSLSTIDGKFYKECEVIILPTNDFSYLYLDDKNGTLHFDKILNARSQTTNCSIYILSDEQIKEYDWYCSPGGIISRHNGVEELPDGWKKIIATTDISLEILSKGINPVYEKLPRPSNEFLEAYVKAQGKIYKVLVEYIYGNPYVLWVEGNRYSTYKLKVSPDNTISIKKLQNEFSKESVLNWLETRFTKEAPLEYIINEYKKKFLNGSNT